MKIQATVDMVSVLESLNHDELTCLLNMVRERIAYVERFRLTPEELTVALVDWPRCAMMIRERTGCSLRFAADAARLARDA